MSLNIEFSVLSYYPSFLRTESIHLGIIFHNINTDERLFKHTENWKRLKTFDDELELDFLKFTLQGIKSELTEDLFSCENSFMLKDYIRFYVNELKFSKVYKVEANNFDEFVQTTTRMYLRYDYPKGSRPSTKDELKFLKSIMEGNSIEYKRSPVNGSYDENINFDYVIGNIGIKLFNLTKTNIAIMINHSKIWAHNARELKDKYNTVILYTNDDLLDKKELNKIFSILKDSGCYIYEFDKFSEALSVGNLQSLIV